MAIANKTRVTRKRGLHASLGVLTATAVLALTAAPGAALAATEDGPAPTTSHVTAEGRFITGKTPLGSLDKIAQLHGAYSPGGQAPETVSNPLKVSILNSLNIDLGDKLQLFGKQGVIQLGALAQYAHTDPLGTQVAASGAISDQGAISVGGSAEAPANAHLNLTGLLGNGAISAITKPLVDELTVDIGALSARAETTTGGDAALSYQLGDIKSRLHSPAVENLSAGVRSVFDSASSGINGLFGADGAISTGINGLVQTLQAGLAAVPLQPLTLKNSKFRAGVDVQLGEALDSILLAPIQDANGAVTISLRDGTIEVDLAKLISTGIPGSSLNTLAPNTELLSAAFVGDVLRGAITEALKSFEQIVVDRLVNALNAVSTTFQVSGELYGLLGTTKLGSLNIDMSARLGDVLSGQVKPEDLKFDVSAIGITLPTESIKNALAGPILAALAKPYSAVTKIIGGVGALLNAPIQAAVTLLTPLTNVLNKVVSLKANVQEAPGHFTDGKAPTDGSSTVTALRVALLPNLTAKSALAQVDLASASVRVGKLAAPVITAPQDGSTVEIPEGTSTGDVVISGTGLAGAEVSGSVTGRTDEARPFTTTVQADGTWKAPLEAVAVAPYTVTAQQKTPYVASENTTSEFAVAVVKPGGNGNTGGNGGGNGTGTHPGGSGNGHDGKPVNNGGGKPGQNGVGLAGTGFDSLPYLGAGVLLLLLGSGAYLLNRRMRDIAGAEGENA